MQVTTTPEEVRTTITEELAQLAGLDPAEVTPEATLVSLDVDSLDLVELGQIIEERYGVELQREDFKDVETVGQALDVITARVG